MSSVLLRYALVCAVSLLIPWAAAAEAPQAFGADLGAMIHHARNQHPEVMAAALEADALAAKASAADSLPDPTVRIDFEDNARGRGIGPNRIGSRTYMVEQSFPLGGKRELRRAIAESELGEALGRRQSMAEDLVLRVKGLQIQRVAVRAGLGLLAEQLALARRALDAADRAYAQGRAGQDAPLAARLTLSRFEIEIARMEGERQRFDARLGALLGLQGTASLEPPGAATPPPPAGLDAEALLALARERNPELAQQARRIERGDQRRRLVAADWVPDVSLGLGVVEEDLGLRSYEAVIALNIPLRWGLRDARKGEAVAESAAARAKQTAIELELAGRLRDGLANLAAQRRIDSLLAGQALPQARATVEAQLRALEQGGGQIGEVLLAQVRLREIAMERVKAQAEQQLILAEIERIVGGEL